MLSCSLPVSFLQVIYLSSFQSLHDEKGYLPPETKQRMEGEKLLSIS